MSYDHNGLQLTTVSDTKNTYRLTAVDLTKRKYAAYAASKPPHKNVWSMHTIALYDDPRDAAFVAQEFEKLYDKVKVRQMIVDANFSEIVAEFLSTIEIPEWKYQADGMSIDDMLGGKYTTNYVDNARDALVEALRVADIKAPAIAKAKELIAQVEKLAKTGLGYREAARRVVTA